MQAYEWPSVSRAVTVCDRDGILYMNDRWRFSEDGVLADRRNLSLHPEPPASGCWT